MILARLVLRPLLRLVPAAFALAAASSVHAVQPLLQHDVVLLEKGEVIEQRVDGGSDAMAAYLKTLGQALNDAMRTHPFVIIGTTIQKNPFYVAADEMLRELRERQAQSKVRKRQAR